MEILEDIIYAVFKICSNCIPIFIFGWSLKRRKLFPLRVLFTVAVCTGIEFLGGSISFRNIFPLYHSLYNVAIFLVISLTMWFNFEEKYIVVLYCCIAGKCVMHISEYASYLIFIWSGRNIFISVAVSIVVFLAAYFLFARRIKSESISLINNVKTVAFGFIAICVTDIITMGFADMVVENNVKVIVYLLILAFVLVVLFLQFGLFNESKIKKEAEIIRQLRYKEREQYEITNETIKLISIKHHDIKSMLESHRKEFSDEEISAINESISLYNISFNTGNKTLDTILTEKLIVCRQYNIKMECLANGTPLRFMSDMDIYSLFLNALNNAIESVRDLEEESKRIIWLKTYLHGNLLCIKVQNYCKNKPKILHGDTIMTTKSDPRYHGYGLKSIKMVAEKYGGTLSVNVENELFNLGIVIPLTDEKIYLQKVSVEE